MYQLNKLKKAPGLIHGFSEIKDGNMSFNWGEKEKVFKSRKTFLDKAGIKIENSVAMFLEHGTDIALVDEYSRGKELAEIDCLMTKSKNVFLFLLTGDCLPVIIYDPVKNALALVHLSRINSPNNFARNVIKKMENQFGSKPKDLIVGVGPCIHKESYVFSAEELRKRIPDEKIFNEFILDLPGDKKAIDLVGYNVEELFSAGVPKENIEISEIDTAKNSNFFSHYRSGLTGEPEGRMITITGTIN